MQIPLVKDRVFLLFQVGLATWGLRFLCVDSGQRTFWFYGGKTTLENNIGKTLHVIGIATIIVGIIGSLILSINLDTDFPITLIVGGIASFISGMVFVGFGEIISLLQKNVDKQDAILNYIKNKSIDEKVAPKTVLQDIEDNLPSM